MRIVWTIELLTAASADSAGDFIELDGDRWRVEKVSRWADHYEAEIVRLEEQPTALEDDHDSTLRAYERNVGDLVNTIEATRERA